MERIINAENLAAVSFGAAEMEAVRFEQCDLSGRDLSGVLFIECQFVDCNLSNVTVSRTAFRECSFISCKLMGVRFDDCIPFLQPPVFKNCDLTLASFVSMKLPSAHFDRCQLLETDFSQADLTGAVLTESNLSGAIFDRTILSKADIQSSYNYSIDPERNSVKQLKVSHANLSGFLEKYALSIQ